jgi:hypothetical protein
MKFDWKDYVEVCRFLEQHAATSPTEEAFLRSAVSRAYYAAFCHLRNYARDSLEFRPRNDADDHGRLHSRLKQGKLRGLALKLERLREWRNECDYQDQLGFDPRRILVLARSQADSILAAVSP